MKDLLEGLGFLHQQDLLHRRIKSENICCTLEGLKPKARFATWGLAIPPAQAQEDRAGAACYMAPEVLFGGGITAQSDLWAMGTLLYNGLTGEAAFPERKAARNLRELKNIAQDEKKPNPLMTFGYFQKLSPIVGEKLKVERLQELLDALLKPDPKERPFASAIAVLGFLQTHWPKLFSATGEFYETISISV